MLRSQRATQQVPRCSGEGSTKAGALKDLPVISMADGAKVGTVKEVVFDTAKLHAVALVLMSAGGEFGPSPRSHKEHRGRRHHG